MKKPYVIAIAGCSGSGKAAADQAGHQDARHADIADRSIHFRVSAVTRKQNMNDFPQRDVVMSEDK